MTEGDSDRPSVLERTLGGIHRKLDLIIQRIGVEMADVTKLNAEIEELGTDEVAAVVELKSLSEEVAQLNTERAPTQEQIDAITTKATAIATALKAGTEAAKPAPVAPAPTAPAAPAAASTPAAPVAETPAAPAPAESSAIPPQ